MQNPIIKTCQSDTYIKFLNNLLVYKLQNLQSSTLIYAWVILHATKVGSKYIHQKLNHSTKAEHVSHFKGGQS
ncbi:hypothetical protein M301_1798 [Methylotenera versatilis 301]|uniref:Uncharacterized protein n=1 Tax=Methylotenera versatilis (strain 301) TaxID=666681 RepID=D7DJE0_METV0|nr:hypothetical protein M301_1798 [Methylotenera versatilis 301]